MEHDVSSKNPVTILVVDDDQEILNLHSAFLTAKGYKVFCCKGGETAIRKLDEISPQLAIIDILMFGLDGATTLRKVREKLGSDFPVIICSSTNLKVSSLDNPRHTRYVRKPIDFDKVESEINSLLNPESPEEIL